MQWLIDILKEWALGYLPKARASLFSPQGIPTGTWTRLNFDVETYDTHSLFANHRFTTARAGYYLVTFTAHLAGPIAGRYFNVSIYKNGDPNSINARHASSTITIGSTVTDILYLEAGDYIEGYCLHNVGADRAILAPDAFTFIAISQLF